LGLTRLFQALFLEIIPHNPKSFIGFKEGIYRHKIFILNILTSYIFDDIIYSLIILKKCVILNIKVIYKEARIMFKIGDKVVCPMRGSGIVEKIEERDFLGTAQEYFIIKILNTDMTLMIPTAKISTSNIRLISDLSTAEDVLHIFDAYEEALAQSVNAKERRKMNMDKISAGSLLGCAEVVRDLTHIHQKKSLNASEREMLMNARKFVINEVSLVKNISESQASSLLDNLLTNSLA
jgi:CarD family transcriptional regulator